MLGAGFSQVLSGPHGGMLRPSGGDFKLGNFFQHGGGEEVVDRITELQNYKIAGGGLWMGCWRWGSVTRRGEIWDRRSRVPPGGWVRRGDSLRSEAFYRISSYNIIVKSYYLI
jgi:hypothetical protein